MININSYNEIETKDINVNEKFTINKGKRTEIYIIKPSINFEGCFELFRTNCRSMSLQGGTYLSEDKYISGCQSVNGCVKMAYDVT